MADEQKNGQAAIECTFNPCDMCEKKCCNNCLFHSLAIRAIQPATNAVEVVRCKDCKKGRPIDRTKSPEKYFKDDCVVCECEDVVGDEPMIYKPTHFCSYGERKEDNATSNS